jgi:integrase
MSSKTEAKLLTALAVSKYRPHPPHRRVVRDLGSRSLFLVIYPTGSMSWMMRFRTSGGIAKMTLGSVDRSGKELTGTPELGSSLSLAAARLLAAEQHRLRAMGKNPAADAKAARERRQAAAIQEGENTFGAAVRDYIQKHAKQRVRNWQDRARMLGLRSTVDGLEVIPGGLAQRWADRPVNKIDGHDIHQLTVETRDKGVPGLKRRSDGPSESMARAMLACVSALFGWLTKQRRVKSNPCATVHRPEAGAARERVLSDDEIKAFWQATAKLPAPFAACLKLLLLTGCRRDEIACLRWEELSDNGTAISLPGSRTKNTRPHVVPLSALARQIIAAIPRIDGCPYVFTISGKAPIAAWSRIKTQLDAAMGKGVPPWRVHDLRRSAVTGLVELGVAPHIVELVVNHIGGARAGVAGVYNRANMIGERRAALERWSRHVEGLVSSKGDNVVAMPTGRKQKR